MSLAFSKLNFDLYLKSGARLAINEGYEQLASAGWEPTGKIHPIDRTWIWSREGATIWYDPIHNFDWKVQVGFNEYGMDGDIQSLTKDVDEMLVKILEKKLAFHNALYMIGSGQDFSDDDDFNNGVT